MISAEATEFMQNNLEAKDLLKWEELGFAFGWLKENAPHGRTYLPIHMPDGKTFLFFCAHCRYYAVDSIAPEEDQPRLRPLFEHKVLAYAANQCFHVREWLDYCVRLTMLNSEILP